MGHTHGFCTRRLSLCTLGLTAALKGRVHFHTAPPCTPAPGFQMNKLKLGRYDQSSSGSLG